jgi:hypothetical protein
MSRIYQRVCPANALLWTEFRTQHDLAGKRVTDNLGRAVGAPKTVQLGDGTTANTIPAQVTGKHGLVFTGTQWVDTGIVDPFERTDKFTLFVATHIPSGSALCDLISSVDANNSNLGYSITSTASRVVHVYFLNRLTTNGIQSDSAAGKTTGLSTSCLTYSGSSSATGILIYSNGALTSMFASQDNLSATIKSGAPIQLGARYAGASRGAFLVGTMYFAAIFPWELTPQQVQYMDRLVKTRINTPIVGRYSSRAPIPVALQRAH